ncbi:MAG: pilus (MSHA type) biogenesis protein MshL [Gallionella sp.]|nr:pilus (MSHA type) biogenesis protein MshL [Gallionella sp.]
MRLRNIFYLCTVSVILAGCGTKPIQPSDKHIQRNAEQPATASGIPQTIKRSVVLPPPKPVAKTETYSVVVTNVSAQEILFALARDAKINLDIHPGIQGTVTLNALNQTLPQILARIAKQIDMRYELDNGNLSVMPDKPFLRTYKIDFINMSRAVKSKISTSTQIASGAGAAGGSTLAGDNSASTSVTSDTQNNLMQSLIDNVKAMLLDEDLLHYQEQVDLQAKQQIQARGTGAVSGSTSLASPTKNTGIEINQAAKGGQVNSSSRTGSSVSGSGNQDVQGQGEAVAKKGVYERAVNVFANNETGVLIVRATSRQHEKVQEFIDKVMATAKRQVLIEATIVEVRLNDNYKQGINWSLLQRNGTGFQLRQVAPAPAGLLPTNANIFTLDYLNPTSRLGNLAASVSLLESFGKVKILSSPKLSIMNNQTATLKVADNRVYFTIDATLIPATTISPASVSYTSTPHTVSVGFFMNVTPQISDSDTVTLNVRPTVSRILGYVNDPNPSLKAAGVVNPVPEIQSREMESIIKIDSGQIAVLGGLMEDRIDNFTDEVPGLSSIPLAGNLFKSRNDTTTKTELVIFLRPAVIKDASIDGDFSAYSNMLPDQNFFKEPANGKP